MLMESHYLGLLNCVLMSWAAAFLPVAVAGFFVDPDLLHSLPVFLAANIYFTALMALSVRTVFGTGFGPAAGMTALVAGAALLGGELFGMVGGSLGFLMSPFVLYYAYLMLGSEVRSLGQGLRSRQHLREQLEIATNNPRDADAHYQLGLIHQQRRQYSEAISRFTQALEIDPARRTRTSNWAASRANRAGSMTPSRAFKPRPRRMTSSRPARFGGSWVRRISAPRVLGRPRLRWRNIRSVGLTIRKACIGTARRWYALNRLAEARALFERSIEAAKTMPRHRRAEVRKWGSLARGELSALKRAI